MSPECPLWSFNGSYHPILHEKPRPYCLVKVLGRKFIIRRELRFLAFNSFAGLILRMLCLLRFGSSWDPRVPTYARKDLQVRLVPKQAHLRPFLVLMDCYGLGPISFSDPPLISDYVFMMVSIHLNFLRLSWPYVMCHVIMLSEPSGIFKEPPRQF